MYRRKITLFVVVLACAIYCSREVSAAMVNPSMPDDDLMELVKKKDVDEIIALWLKDAKKGVRKDGMYSGALLSLESEKIVPAFIKAYETKNERIMAQSFPILACLDCPDELLKVVLRVREIETAEDFGVIPEELKKKVEELVGKLYADKFEVRDKAKKELIALGGQCAGILGKYRNHPRIEVRYSVEQILLKYKESGDTAKPPKLSRSAETELMTLLRSVKPQHAREIARMVLQANYSNSRMLEKALLVLAEHGTAADAGCAGGFLQHKSSNVRLVAIRAVAKTGGKEYIGEIRKFLDNRLCATTAALALARLGDKDSLDRIRKSFDDGWARSKTHSHTGRFLLALAIMGDRERVERVLDSDTPKCGLAAVREVGDRQYLNKVLDAFKNSRREEDLLEAVECLLTLSKKTDKKVFSAIHKRTAAVKQVDSRLYDKLMTLLLRYGDDEAISAVRSMLKSDDVMTRKNAIDLIRNSRNAKLAPYLQPLLDDKTTFRIFHGLGGYRTASIDQYATDAICGFAGKGIWLWRFDPDRQRREIDRWFKENSPQK